MLQAAILILFMLLLLVLRRYEMSRLRLKASVAEFQADLRVASRIQRRFMPAAPPSIAGYDLAICNLPQREIGGDYTDFVAIDGDRLAVCHGDVAGKGLPAALLMACFQAIVRSQATLGLAPSDCARGANRALFQSVDEGNFASLFYAVLDHRRHVLQYCNAGHEEPILARRAGGTAHLNGGGLVLGVIEDATYETQEREFGPGDLLVLYSDGITDAEDQMGRPFGTGRLENVVSRAAGQPAAAVIDAILAAVRRHLAGAPLPDDVSLLVITRRE